MWYLAAPQGQIQGLLTGQAGSRRVVRDVIVFIGIHRHWQSVVRPCLCHRLHNKWDTTPHKMRLLGHTEENQTSTLLHTPCPYNRRCVWLPWVCPGCGPGLTGYGGRCGGCGWWSSGCGGGCWRCRCRSGSWSSGLVELSADLNSFPDKSRISVGCESKTPVSADLEQKKLAES